MQQLIQYSAIIIQTFIILIIYVVLSSNNLQNLFLISLRSSVKIESQRMAISSGMGYIQAAIAHAMAPIVSESPPSEIAKRRTSSKEFPSRNAIMASGTLP